MRFELPEGYSIMYRHFRGDDKAVVYVHQKPRFREATTALVFDQQGRYVTSARAVCRPGDQFSKQLGRAIAGGRALKRIAALSKSSFDELLKSPSFDELLKSRYEGPVRGNNTTPFEKEISS